MIYQSVGALLAQDRPQRHCFHSLHLKQRKELDAGGADYDDQHGIQHLYGSGGE
jgi:hypothetical protein